MKDLASGSERKGIGTQARDDAKARPSLHVILSVNEESSRRRTRVLPSSEF